jgi:hypothetical protein
LRPSSGKPSKFVGGGSDASLGSDMHLDASTQNTGGVERH